MATAAVFLDRDGVINKKPPLGKYVRTWAEFEWLPGVMDSLQLLTEKGHPLFIVTNQAGVGRKIMSQAGLADIHEHMQKDFAAHGVKITHIYYCPHSFAEGDVTRNTGCTCRKPDIGMMLQAEKDFSVDLKKAYMVGDSEDDIEAGQRAGMTTIGIGKHIDASLQPDFIATDLREAVRYILEHDS